MYLFKNISFVTNKQTLISTQNFTARFLFPWHS